MDPQQNSSEGSYSDKASASERGAVADPIYANPSTPPNKRYRVSNDHHDLQDEPASLDDAEGKQMTALEMLMGVAVAATPSPSRKQGSHLKEKERRGETATNPKPVVASVKNDMKTEDTVAPKREDSVIGLARVTKSGGAAVIKAVPAPQTKKPGAKRKRKPPADIPVVPYDPNPGDCVWAKCDGFPWWPAKVLSQDEIANKEMQVEGFNVLRFFGTYDTAVLKSDRIQEWTDELFPILRKRSRTRVFYKALAEGDAFKREGTLPKGYLTAQAASFKKLKKPGGRGRKPLLTPEEKAIKIKADRQIKILRRLGLMAPDPNFVP